MRWVRDLTGRFPQRPHYDPREIDEECERVVFSFLREKHGEFRFPISTEDLTILIERDASDLDLYADLSGEGEDIEGITDFFPNRKPSVRISKELSVGWREHRLRTTLTHEYGHVKLHGFLWSFDQRKLFPTFDPGPGPRCKRSNILDAPVKDWMEWQAGYACGALLMPIAKVRGIVQDSLRKRGLYNNWVIEGSDHEKELIDHIVEVFDVSREAAKVRLAKLSYLSKVQYAPSLFGS